MNAVSQTEEKKTIKYHIVDRVTQTKILDESQKLSQRKLAQKYDIPRTTLQHWMDRKQELRGGSDPNIVNFFESPSGQAWLHNMILATFIIFHQN